MRASLMGGAARFAVPLVCFVACQPEVSAPENPPDYVDPDPYHFPISIRGREFVDAEGQVIVLIGDTPWALAAQLDSGDVRTYLTTRAAQGVNAVTFSAIEHLYADGAPENAYGDAPFRRALPGSATPDFTSLDPSYWSYVEWIVDEARSRGMVVLLLPGYVGFRFDESGWSAEMKENGPARLRAYGDSLARRFGGFGNVVWVMGGDWGQERGSVVLHDEISALAAGIDGRMPGAIFSAHANRQRSALDAYNEPWLDVNTTYSDTLRGPSRLLDDARRTGLGGGRDMPTLWIEGYYENEHGMDDEKLRAQLYWTLLSGGSGHFYGAFPVWSFDAESASSFRGPDVSRRITWQDALQSRMAGQLVHARTLVDSVPLVHLDPLDDLGLWPTEQDPRSVAASWSAQDSVLVGYVRGGLRLELPATQFTEGRSASWMDPRTGQWRSAESTGSTEAYAFTPPSDEDWILVLRGLVRR